ncbi:unnamed protein product [Darwinula stevensoni]|uniref:Uncharacterized protein n=1 Tax=Darwinula stevensoni TaxID=69355 RepID=A0A7R9A9R9_9CRUS|nr:unnamed protein product [Darwinula stevensoni]CAG0897694.1 unnamed protein product [Darwinula stevensoni]
MAQADAELGDIDAELCCGLERMRLNDSPTGKKTLEEIPVFVEQNEKNHEANDAKALTSRNVVERKQVIGDIIKLITQESMEKQRIATLLEEIQVDLACLKRQFKDNGK